jgi:hypothetical protein
VLILESQRIKIIKGKNYTSCKNREKYNIWWEVSETMSVTVNGTQTYHWSVNGQEA